MRSIKKISSNVEATAAAMESMVTGETDPSVVGVQAVANAIAPAVFPTERWRQDTKDSMLREFRRPRGSGRADAGSLDGLETSPGSVVRVETGTGSVTLANLESISDAEAEAAVESIARIVARHEDRTHLS